MRVKYGCLRVVVESVCSIKGIRENVLSIFVIANTIMFLVITTKAFPVATLITILRELDLAGAEGVAIAGEGAEVVVDF